MNRLFASTLTLSLGISITLAPWSHAQNSAMTNPKTNANRSTGAAPNANAGANANSRTNSNADPNRGVTRITPENETQSSISNSMAGGAGGMENGEQKGAQLPQFSGNLPTTVNEDRTHGVNAPGTMIGPAPENGQPDPRFPNSPGSSGGGNDINAKSSAGGAAQAPTGADKMQGAGQTGGTTSDLNEGLPSASMDNSGATSTEGSSNVAAESRGAFPYVAGAIGFIIAMFLGTMVWAKAKKNR